VDLEPPYPILGLVPGLAWLLYFYRQGRARSKSFPNILRVFLAGCACTAPTGVIEHITGAGLLQDTLLRSAEVSFFLIGPVEEFFKLLAVWMAIYRRPDFREPIDGIVYATTAALGFACVENAIYLSHLGPAVLVSRAVFATPAHVLFASMWGYSLGLARFRREGELWIVTKGFLTAASFHGAYNFLVAIHPKTAVLSLLPLMLFMGWLMTKRIREFRSHFPFPALGEVALVPCPNCGAYAPEDSDSCPRCGVSIWPVEVDTPRFCGRCRARLDPCRDKCPGCGAALPPSSYCPSRGR
jgi:protease PrsW